MPLSNVLAGAAFKTALWSLLAFLLTLFATGYAVYQLVESAMYKELAGQMTEELLLFQKIENESGKQGIIDTITELDSPAASPHRVLGLFDANGNNLAGNKQIAPDFVGWKSVTVNALLPDKSGEYYSHVMPLDTTVLVIGRSTDFITAVLQRLQRFMLVACLVVLVSTMVLGYVLSYRVNRKLGRMTHTLGCYLARRHESASRCRPSQ
jgi:hypothetical protein